MKTQARIGHRGPQFLGIGAQKAGTTWLYEALSRHPHIRFPAGKELHFWSARRDLGLQWYLARFGAPQPEVRLGEITPAYALLADPVIREVQAMNPSVRLLYVLRNPIERAWSSALMALMRAEMEIGEASEAWFVDHFRSAGSLARGDYETTIRRWRRVFGANALLLLRFEDISATPVELLMRCARHLDVPDGVFATTNPGVLQVRVFNGGGHPLPPRLRAALHGLYRDRILRLGDYLDWDLSAWLDDSPGITNGVERYVHAAPGARSLHDAAPVNKPESKTPAQRRSFRSTPRAPHPNPLLLPGGEGARLARPTHPRRSRTR